MILQMIWQKKDHNLPAKKSSKNNLETVIVGFGQADVLGFRERERERENQLKRNFKNQPTKDRKDEIGKKTGKQKTKKG